MLQISTIVGNINTKDFRFLQNAKFEKLKISRIDLEKNRLRRLTDSGTDIALVLEPGSHLHDGDILNKKGKYIVIEQIPEKVLTVKLKEKSKDKMETIVLLGHIIGNRHRPISIEQRAISFPVQSEDEVEIFEKLLCNIIDEIELIKEEKIFIPHSGAATHEH